MRRAVIALLIAAPFALLTVWIARNTEWVDTTLPMPPKGEALTNPFYAAQLFAGSLGARTVRDRVFTPPSPESVVVLSTWHWTLNAQRQETLERWVESGGRLVIDDLIVGGERELAQWSGIERRFARRDVVRRAREVGPASTCHTVEESTQRSEVQRPGAITHLICDVDESSSLISSRQITWSLKDASGIQALRVRVGRGSVTRINSSPFRDRSLLEGDHGWLFVAATELRRGDEVLFLSEGDHPTLLALVWQRGAPVVVLCVSLVAIMLWRGAVRLGPLASEQRLVRRSLAEQIRGTGRFALAHGGGAALHAAAVRALLEAAERRVPSYMRLEIPERTAALAGATALEPAALAAAMHFRPERSVDLRHTLELLEATRRRLLTERPRSAHGTN